MICAGPLRLLHPGGEARLTPELVAPTNHHPGQHGDLYSCGDCGTVHQPGLPRGEELTELYRGMTDEAYLSEEAGRRATATRLLDLIQRHVSAGSLLDVGCGHGLLLDEARRRGFTVTGLELSQAAASYAREVLELDVREQRVEELRPPAGGYQVVVLADVIEHLDDPLAALDACAGLLAPGGALCVVTPDAGSRTARLAGPRWWAYIPAHTFLFTRGTLRELLEARGLVLSEDQPLRRSFELRYWTDGLAERGGRVTSLARGLARTPLGRRRLTMSLGDERVMLANMVPVARAQRPLMRDRGGDFKVHVVLPAYRAADTIPEVARSMPVESADRALLVDDASPDDTVGHRAAGGARCAPPAVQPRLRRESEDLLRPGHSRRRGRGRDGPRRQPVRPGARRPDGQADRVRHRRRGDRLPAARGRGNRGRDAALEVGRQPLSHHGREPRLPARLLGVPHGLPRLLDRVPRSIAFLRNDDGFVFDQEIFAQMVARRARVLELPIPTRYFREASTVSFGASVEYGLRTLGVLARYRFDERRGSWPLLRPPAARLEARAGERRPDPAARG